MLPSSDSFYARDTITVARDLLGRLLCHDSAEGFTAGIIVETEAYLSRDDPACHAARGITRRNAAMFGPPGSSYIYFIYGNHYCFNVVTAPQGVGEAVLVRALEPVAGLDLMKQRRRKKRLTELAGGPGMLCQAMGITADLNGRSLQAHPLWICCGPEKYSRAPIELSPRIGISRGSDKLLRFYLHGNQFVSRRGFFGSNSNYGEGNQGP